MTKPKEEKEGLTKETTSPKGETPSEVVSEFRRAADNHPEDQPIKLYSFSWLPFAITEEEAQALRLVKGVAIYAGKSVRQPIADLETEENLLRGGRSLRGALIDIDHAAVLEVDTQVYKEKYGLENLFPVGQVWDAEYEDGKVEFIASIWEPKVYDLIRENGIKCSVLEEYRKEELVCTTEECTLITEGSTFPLLALTLEKEPAFPDTWVKPFEVASEAEEVEILKPTELAEHVKQPRYVQMPIVAGNAFKAYTLEQDGQGVKVKLETLQTEATSPPEEATTEIQGDLQASTTDTPPITTAIVPASEKTHGAVESHEPPKAPEDRAWDADAAEARLRSWAGGPEKENIDWEKYRQGFAWYDEGDRENLGAYKLPHHDIIDGSLHTVWRGVAAAMAALMGGRGGVDIPSEDRQPVYNHLRRHYEQFDKEPPELQSLEEQELAKPTSEEKEEANLRLTVDVSDEVSGELREVADTLAKVNEKLEEQGRVIDGLKSEIQELREEKQRVEQELAELKEDHTRLSEMGRAKPTGIIEAHPARQVKGRGCRHTNFLAALPEDRDVPRKIPSDIFRGWMEAAERNVKGCPHESLLKPYTLNKDFIPIKFVSQETLLQWLHNVRRVLSREV